MKQAYRKNSNPASGTQRFSENPCIFALDRLRMKLMERLLNLTNVKRKDTGL
jgi:hypothetical protein